MMGKTWEPISEQTSLTRYATSTSVPARHCDALQRLENLGEEYSRELWHVNVCLIELVLGYCAYQAQCCKFSWRLRIKRRVIKAWH